MEARQFVQPAWKNSYICKHKKLSFRLMLSEVPILSKTDIARQWGKVHEKRHEAEKPSRFLDLYHMKPKFSK